MMIGISTKRILFFCGKEIPGRLFRLLTVEIFDMILSSNKLNMGFIFDDFNRFIGHKICLFCHLLNIKRYLIKTECIFDVKLFKHQGRKANNIILVFTFFEGFNFIVTMDI